MREDELANQLLGLCELLVGQGRCYSLSLKLSTGFAFNMESTRYPAEKRASSSMKNDVLESTKKKNPSRVRRDTWRRSLLLLKKREEDRSPLAVSPPSAGTSLPGAGNQLLSDQESNSADREGKGNREAEEINDHKVNIKRGWGSFEVGRGNFERGNLRGGNFGRGSVGRGNFERGNFRGTSFGRGSVGRGSVGRGNFERELRESELRERELWDRELWSRVTERNGRGPNGGEEEKERGKEEGEGKRR